MFKGEALDRSAGEFVDSTSLGDIDLEFVRMSGAWQTSPFWIKCFTNLFTYRVVHAYIEVAPRRTRTWSCETLFEAIT